MNPLKSFETNQPIISSIKGNSVPALHLPNESSLPDTLKTIFLNAERVPFDSSQRRLSKQAVAHPIKASTSNIPGSVPDMMKRMEIEKKFKQIQTEEGLGETILPELSRQALSIHEPELAFKIAEGISNEILKMASLKNLIRYYLSNNEIDEAVRVVLAVSSEEAKIQLIKAIAHNL